MRGLELLNQFTELLTGGIAGQLKSALRLENISKDESRHTKLAQTAATSNKNTMLTKKSTISTKFIIIIIIVVKKIGNLINSRKNNKKESISRKNRAQDSSLKANNTGMYRNKTSLHLMLLFNSIPRFPLFLSIYSAFF